MRAGGALGCVVGLAAAGCAAGTGSRTAGADGPSPFSVVLTEYSIPIALGAASPDSVGGWNDRVSFKRWVQGWTHRPVPHDVDNTFVNYVLHPVAGSETHLLARRRGWSFGEAFLFDVFSSVAWEYVFENLYEPPSRVDLMVTAPGGALLGELRWQAKQAGILPGLMDPLDGHGEPFFEFHEDGVLFGLQRRF